MAESQTAGAPVSDALGPTATAMLDAAERLFAERSIDGVSIREIVRASGQSNSYALHYHFGSRDALIGALMERRIRALDAMRMARLREWDASGREDSVHGLVSMSIRALADAVRHEPWGPDYVCVAAQVLFSPQLSLRELVDPRAWSAQAAINARLRQLLAGLPQRVFDERMRILSHEAIYAIARWVRSHGAVTPRNAKRFYESVEIAIDFLAAGFAEPPSRG